MRPTPGVLVLAWLVAGCTQPLDPRGVARDEVLLQVVASGRTDTRPDEARFVAGVSTIAATAAAASAGNNAILARVLAAVEGLGVGKDDVQTQAITLARIDYGRDRGRFQADNRIEVRVRAIDKAGQAIAAATEARANVLSGPELRVSDPEAAGRAGYAQAYRAARARAEAYAAAADMRVARVLAIRDAGTGGDDGPLYETDALIPAPVSAAPFRAGTNSSEVRVRADFALKPK